MRCAPSFVNDFLAFLVSGALQCLLREALWKTTQRAHGRDEVLAGKLPKANRAKRHDIGRAFSAAEEGDFAEVIARPHAPDNDG